MRARFGLLAAVAGVGLAHAACATGAGSDADAPDGAAGGDASIGADGGRDASDAGTSDAGTSDAGTSDAGWSDAGWSDVGAGGGDAGSSDAGSGDGAAGGDGDGDGAPLDSGAFDAGSDSAAGGGIITGGPCMSGAAGATAFRIRWVNSGGVAQVQYEAYGLPDRSRDRAGAYGYQIGFSPSFVDPFLGAGGLQLDGSDFIDLELSTAGVASIASATLSIFGRSYATTTSGSFNWQTIVGTDGTATDFVSNVAPYRWYSADLLPVLRANDSGVLLRIKAGPSSDALVVNRVEICMRGN